MSFLFLSPFHPFLSVISGPLNTVLHTSTEAYQVVFKTTSQFAFPVWWKRSVRAIAPQPPLKFKASCRILPLTFWGQTKVMRQTFWKNLYSIPFQPEWRCFIWRAPWQFLYCISLQCVFFHSLSIMVSFFTPHSVSHQFSFHNYIDILIFNYKYDAWEWRVLGDSKQKEGERKKERGWEG